MEHFVVTVDIKKVTNTPEVKDRYNETTPASREVEDVFHLVTKGDNFHTVATQVKQTLDIHGTTYDRPKSASQ